MWSLLLSGIAWCLSIFGRGKPDPFKQGVVAGKAEATVATQSEELNDIIAAKTASDRVSVNLSEHPDELRRPDKFERP